MCCGQYILPDSFMQTELLCAVLILNLLLYYPTHLLPLLSDAKMWDPLYPGASITLCGALLAIMQFCRGNNLSYSAIDDLLKLLILLCPIPNLIPSSLHRFKKFFKHYQPAQKITKLCVTCQNTTCSCLVASKYGHLITMDIMQPFQTIVAGELYIIIS